MKGEPGIGKSTLVRTATAVDAARLLRVGGDELSTTFPLLPVLEALRALPTEAADYALLAQVLRSPGVDPVAAASQLPVELVECWCISGPVIVVLDGAHWVDDATLAVWSRLARLSDRWSSTSRSLGLPRLSPCHGTTANSAVLAEGRRLLLAGSPPVRRRKGPRR